MLDRLVVAFDPVVQAVDLVDCSALTSGNDVVRYQVDSGLRRWDRGTGKQARAFGRPVSGPQLELVDGAQEFLAVAIEAHGPLPYAEGRARLLPPIEIVTSDSNYGVLTYRCFDLDRERRYLQWRGASQGCAKMGKNGGQRSHLSERPRTTRGAAGTAQRHVTTGRLRSRRA
jgi:hypothetical protein